MVKNDVRNYVLPSLSLPRAVPPAGGQPSAMTSNYHPDHMEDKLYCVYILTNKNNKILYTGVTSDLPGRIYQHKNKLVDGFTKKYNVDKLVYYETTEYAIFAITREKQIKAGSRKKKLELINSFNPEWKDLYKSII